eukprot:TRINITY_DN56087_c0_g1_i1.p1 TRINITY_DN56087_c0_g1~~TRINITY_DN56087_c0_g1_i1.p1  ORF type:complete len:379 (+),score=109.50 TRINITY_DN56087_c0_g1_i1:88-1137(+)
MAQVSGVRRDSDTARYCVEYLTASGVQCKQWKRYTEFVNLRRALGELKLPPLPPKTILPVRSDAELQQRRVSLDAFIKAVASSGSPAAQRELKKFVGDTSSASAPGAAAPPPREQADPAPAAAQPDVGAASAEAGRSESPAPLNSAGVTEDAGSAAGRGGSGSPVPPQDAGSAQADDRSAPVKRDPDELLWDVVRKAREYFIDADHSFCAPEAAQDQYQGSSSEEHDWSTMPVEHLPCPAVIPETGFPSMHPAVTGSAAVLDGDWAARSLVQPAPPPRVPPALGHLCHAVAAALEEGARQMCNAPSVVAEFPVQAIMQGEDAAGADEGCGSLQRQKLASAPSSVPASAD